MDWFIHQQNIERYRRLLVQPADEEQRLQLLKLLAEQEAKDVAAGPRQGERRRLTPTGIPTPDFQIQIKPILPPCALTCIKECRRRGPARSFDDYAGIFRCPLTGYNVQGWVSSDEIRAEGAPRRYS